MARFFPNASALTHHAVGSYDLFSGECFALRLPFPVGSVLYIDPRTAEQQMPWAAPHKKYGGVFMPIVYGTPLSPFVRKVMVALAEKAMPYDFELVVAINPTPEYKKISPLGKVPAFRDGESIRSAIRPSSSPTSRR